MSPTNFFYSFSIGPGVLIGSRSAKSRSRQVEIGSYKKSVFPDLSGTGPGTAARQRKQQDREGEEKGREGREEGKERGREGAVVRAARKGAGLRRG
jgi:hypothetical protein